VSVKKTSKGVKARKAGIGSGAVATDKGTRSTEATSVMDSRSSGERRTASDRRKKQATVAAERRHMERRTKISRRRQIDPTTCERDYTVDELEFMNALDEYKRTSGRMFPTCSEVLEVVRNLGYEKRSAAAGETSGPLVLGSARPMTAEMVSA
jgi:hypothetical protein